MLDADMARYMLPRVDDAPSWISSDPVRPHPTRNALYQSRTRYSAGQLEAQFGSVSRPDLVRARLGKVDCLALSTNLDAKVLGSLVKRAPKQLSRLLLWVDRPAPELLPIFAKCRSAVWIRGPEAGWLVEQLPVDLGNRLLDAPITETQAGQLPTGLGRLVIRGPTAALGRARERCPWAKISIEPTDEPVPAVLHHAAMQNIGPIQVLDGDAVVGSLKVPREGAGAEIDLPASEAAALLSREVPPGVKVVRAVEGQPGRVPWSDLQRWACELRRLTVHARVDDFAVDSGFLAPSLEHLGLLGAGLNEGDVPTLRRLVGGAPALRSLDVSANDLPCLGPPAFAAHARRPADVIDVPGYDDLISLDRTSEADEVVAAWGRRVAKDLHRMASRLLHVRSLTQLQEAQAESDADFVFAAVQNALWGLRNSGVPELVSLVEPAVALVGTVREGLAGDFGNDVHVYARAALEVLCQVSAMRNRFHPELGLASDPMGWDPVTLQEAWLALADGYRIDWPHLAEEIRAKYVDRVEVRSLG